jgi:serine/threonine protein kinase/tetratricopeptide (TPR) repeat protein
MSELNLIGTTVGRFEVLSELGRGGMAVVYKARQTDLDRVVALKILPPALTHDTGYVARFRQEARSAARLEHPHIMPIYEVGEANGLHYIAMKFIEGQTVKDLVAEEGALSVHKAASLLAQVGDALDYAHRRGVIHRDIKPSNMMVTAEGWVFLTDFGLARGTSGDTGGLTMAGTVMGTPEYMSPEQAQGLPNVGPPTDIYALGVVLYELLTGTFPFQADTPMGMLAARLLQTPTPPRDVRGDLPVAVEDVVMRALARKPEARFPSAATMVSALRAASGIGNAEPQRPATPVAGMPAMGDTIRAPAVATPLPPAPVQPTPPSNPPYVRPADPTLPVTRPSVGATPQPALALPADIPAQAPQAQAALKKGPNTFVVIAVALGLVMVLSCVGIFVIASSESDTPPVAGPTTVVDSGIGALLEEGDAALAEEGGIEDAIASYQEALAEAPGDPAAIEKLALVHSARADWASVEEYANLLIDAGASSERQVALGYALLADALASQGDVVSAAREAAEAVRIAPDLALGHAVQSNLQSAAAAARGDAAAMDAALDTLGLAEDTLGADPPLLQALTHNALGYTFAQEYLLSGNQDYFEQSEASYEEAIDLQPALALFPANLGYLYSAAGDFGEARDQFDEALDLDPRLTTAQSGIGWSYYQEGDTAEAEAAFDKAMALDGGHFDAYYGKGRIAYDAANDLEAYGAAAALLRQAAERNPRSAEVQAYLGESLLFQGFQTEDGAAKSEAYAAAEAAYRKAIELNDSYAFPRSGLGWILQYQERYEESVAAFEEAMALDDSTDEVHNGMAWSLYNLGRYDEAEASFRAAIERDSDNNYASAHYGLGSTLEALGRIDEARAAYEAALAINPDYSDAQEALDSLGA